MATLNGTAGDDNLTGTGDGDDFHLEQGGHDIASGGAGIDVFYMGAAFDGGDRIDGGADKDYLMLAGNYAKGVAFTATTLTNVEEIQLGAGFKYRLTGLTDANVGSGLTIDGSDLGHKDKITIDASGVAGGDLTIIGGAGADTLTGGQGHTTIDGGEGNNVITGGAAADDLSAGDGDNSIRGGEGNDTIVAGNGDDTLGGGRGDDTFALGSGANTVTCGEGNDLVYAQPTADDHIDGGDGLDTIYVANSATLSGANIVNFETVLYSGAITLVTDDALVAAGQKLSVSALNHVATFYATLNFDGSAETDGSFSVIGGKLADSMVGGAGDDKLAGDRGADFLSGGGGDDSLKGGASTDTLYGGDGNDKLDAGYSRYFGGSDLLDGGAGNDSLTSGNGGNTLVGGAGDDRLVSTHGGTQMNGGAGQDVMTGSQTYGHDIFVFNAVADSTADAPDEIKQLASTSTIDLHAIDADATTAGDQAFHLVASFGGHAGELVLSYDSLRDTSSLMGDVDGDGAADFVVRIDGDATHFTGFVL